jgi:imidazolonepropionase-like amidohydrolase
MSAGISTRAGRYAARPGSPAQEILYSAENAYVTLLAGFTTIQSPGQANDVELRDAIARGMLPGPRIPHLDPAAQRAQRQSDEIREKVRQLKTDGADVIKIFASASIREGGKQTMTDAQLQAACGEAKAIGIRTMVHAHSTESVKATVNAGCDQVEHGALIDQEALTLMAAKGVYFDPNVGVVLQNYLSNKAKFLGIGNYNEEGFAYMEKGLALNAAMMKKAATTPNLKLVLGTDAVAGRARPQRRRDRRAGRQGNQRPMDADRLRDVDGGAVAEPGEDDRHAGRGIRGRPDRGRRRPADRHHRGQAGRVRDEGRKVYKR